MSKEIIIKTNKTTNYLYSNLKNTDVATVFLHGFMGSSKSWEDIIHDLNFPCLLFDLPGHGKSIFNNLSAKYDIDTWCHEFNYILDYQGLSKVNLMGYSMGGRLSIAFASKYPDKVNKLILESCSLGIKDSKQRGVRFDQDLSLCDQIQTNLYGFVEKWENNELFLKQQVRNPEGFLSQRKHRLLANSKQLAKSLKSFSLGKMDWMDEVFAKFQFPIYVINGSEDSKYLNFSKKMSEINDNVIHRIIPNSGHNTHLEQKTDFIDCMKGC